MTRSPLHAWRKLFALGGAPAASHAVLSRAPASERLFEPMARARVAHETSLDALTRPLDLGRMLSRVTDAVAAREVPVDAATHDAVARRKPRARQTTAATTPAKADVARPKSSAPAPTTRKAPDAAAVRAAVARTFETHAVERTRAKFVAEAETPRARRFERPVAPTAVASHDEPAVSVDRAPAKAARIVHSIAADAGARARVIVGTAVPNIERLLAVATPSAAVPKSRTPVASEATPARRHPTNDGSPAAKSQDISRLLARAVDRASAPIASAPNTQADWRPSPAAASAPAPATAEPTQRVTTQVAAPDIETSGGGFRGLAQRTLVPANGRGTPVRRIEPEARVPMDLTLDTLDSKVADSLARVLEREARRHGIDLAEAGA